MAPLGLHCYMWAFSRCHEWGLLIGVASFVAEHRLQTCRLSNCGSRAQLLRGLWDLPRPGLEPVSPALAGRFSTTAPPEKPRHIHSLSSKFLKWANHPFSSFLILLFLVFLSLGYLAKVCQYCLSFQKINSLFCWFFLFYSLFYLLLLQSFLFLSFCQFWTQFVLLYLVLWDVKLGCLFKIFVFFLFYPFKCLSLNTSLLVLFLLQPINFGMLYFHFHFLRIFSNFSLDFFFDPLVVEKYCLISTFFWFSIFPLLLIYHFIPLCLEKVLCMISILLNLIRLVLWQTSDLSWIMFHVWLRRLLFCWMFCIWLLSSVGL